MRVLVVSANRERSPFPVAPLGALCVSAAARAAGHDADLLDLTFSPSPRRAIRRTLRSKPYDAVGLSIRNLDNCFYTCPKSYCDEVRTLAETIRRSSPAPLVLGGSGFSVEPRGWLDRLPADYGVVGEGEAAFVALLDRIGSGARADDIPGVVAARNAVGIRPEGVACGAGASLEALAPPSHTQCRYRRYIRTGGFVGIQSKRGCPFECIYCVYPWIEGTEYRLRPAASVAEEIRDVAREQGARDFFFTDSVFNSPREHALAVCREIAATSPAIRWMAYCNPVGFDAELAREMARAGCVGVEFGLDAVTEKTIDRLGKPFRPDEIRACLKAASDAKIPFAVHLLFGGPTETLADVEESQRFLDSCATPNAIFASVGLRVYAHTPLERIARAEGVLSPETDLFEPFYYVSKELGDDPVGAVDRIARRRVEWTTASDWMKPSLRLIQTLINRMGIRPQWRDIRNYGKHMRRPPKDETA
ncbi:radical SAM protein [Candidatus Sumerlaeota bacterium]|nr:radical SAM protein [Candidatus Sumerlaeota bacterium]